MSSPDTPKTDVQEHGANQQVSDRRLFMQLHVFGGCLDAKGPLRALESSRFEAVLYQVGQRMELAADEADDEIVVVQVEAMAGQTDVVGQIGVAVGAAQDAVLPNNRALLLGREPAEATGAAQRVPDPPRPRRVQRRTARAAQQPFVQIGLES